MSLTVRNATRNNAIPIEMEGNGPFVFTFTPKTNANASAGMNHNMIDKAHEKSCLLRELLLLISEEDSISYMTNFASNTQKQNFGEYQDDATLETTLREVISLMTNKNILTSNPRVRVRMERLREVYGIDLTTSVSEMEGGRKKRSPRSKKVPKRRITKK